MYGTGPRRSKRRITIEEVESEEDVPEIVEVRRITRSQVPKTSKSTIENAQNASQANSKNRNVTKSLSQSFFASPGKKSSQSQASQNTVGPGRKSVDLLVSRFQPRKLSELAVNKGKVKEVEDWLELRLTNKRRNLLITGPSGSGKVTTLRLLAANLNFSLSEWEREEEYEVKQFDDTISEGAELQSFFKFFRGGRAACFDVDKPIVLLFKEIPHQAFKDLRSFQKRLAEVLASCRYPVVFSLTDLDSCYELSPKRAFPADFLEENNFDHISFNPVATRYMRQALTRLADKLKGTKKVSSKMMKDIELIANGDLRCAINMLEFSLEGNGDVCSSMVSATKDEIFHMLGRLLYAKRLEPEYSQISNDSLRDVSLHRPPTEKDVNKVLEMTNTSNDVVMLFIHEHEPHFAPSISCLRKVFDDISLSDSLSDRWEVKGKSVPYAAQISARSTMFWNFGPKPANRSMYKMCKPRWFAIGKEVRDLNRELQDSIHLVDLGSDFKKLQIPMIAHLSISLEPQQIGVISYLTRPYSFSRVAGRELWENSRKVKEAKTFRRNTGPQIMDCKDEPSALPVPFSLLEPTSKLEETKNEDNYTIEESEEEADSFDEDWQLL